MSSAAKLAATLAALVLGAATLAGCNATTAPQAADPSQKPAASQTPEPSSAEPEADAEVPEEYEDVGNGTRVPVGGPGECESSAYIHIGSEGNEPMHVWQGGADLVDMGPNNFANGEVGLDNQGRPATYTVAPGDVLSRIGERFCIYNGILLGLLNGYTVHDVIQPGDVLTLNADLVTDWVDPYAVE
jgi:LysM repeat protein